MYGLAAFLLVSSTASGLIMPMTKSDGSVDLLSLVNHISLLEQTIESKDSTADVAKLKSQLESALEELKEVKSELQETNSKVAVLEFQLRSTQPTSSGTTDVTSLKNDVSSLKTDVLNFMKQVNATGGGATYVRWGKTACPAGNKIIYKGYTGGTNYENQGGATTMLCLPEDPIYDVHTIGTHGASIWGSEYDYYYSDIGRLYGLFDDDVPCVVCQSENKRSVMMVPAKNQCYHGWSLEYWGYLNGPHDRHSSSEYICVDHNPEARPGSKDDKNGRRLYLVESHCGSLPCPPYENNWELTCAVCSQ